MADVKTHEFIIRLPRFAVAWVTYKRHKAIANPKGYWCSYYTYETIDGGTAKQIQVLGLMIGWKLKKTKTWKQ